MVMQIGTVAKQVGLTPDAIRFYERNALLPRPPRTAGGFRQYADADLQTLEFTLKEVRQLLGLRRRRFQPCAPVRRRLEQKLSHVRGKLADLHKLEQELRTALRACKKELRRRTARCPLLSESVTRKPENVK